MQLVATPLEFSSTSSKNRGWIHFVVISVALHLLFVVFMQHQVKIGVVVEPEQQKPLNAYFVTLPPPEIVEPVNVPQEQSVQIPEVESSEIETPELETPKEQLEDEIAEQEVLEQEKHEQPLVEVPDLPAIESPVKKEQAEITANSSSQQVYNSTQSYFESLEQSALEDVSLEEAQQYRYNQLHPQVSFPNSSSTYSPTGGTSFNKPIKPAEVDCNSTVKKGLTFLSALTGGRVRCSGGGDIDSFIDKRLAKENVIEPKKSY